MPEQTFYPRLIEPRLAEALEDSPGSHVIAGVEVKASATVRRSDFNGLRKLRGAAGDRFRDGVVLYDGETAVPFGDGLYAVPIPRLWE